MTEDEYHVVPMPFPGDILAAVRVDADGYPTIYYNDALAPDARAEAIRHELAHLEHGDFDNHVTIYDAEKRAVCCAKHAILPRSFRPLTKEEELKLFVSGVGLFAHSFGPYECTEPLILPAPVFDHEPQENLNVQFTGW